MGRRHRDERLARTRWRLVGRLERAPIIGIGPAGVLGILILVVEEACPPDVASTVTVLIPFAPAAAALRWTVGGAGVEVIARTHAAAGALVDFVRAERITVLFRGEAHE